MDEKTTVSGEVTTKERILNVAIDLFAVKGFDAVSLREIADAAGVRKATLYYYFNTKDEILEKILEYVLEIWDQSKIGKWSDSDDAEAQILSMGLDGFMAMASGVSGSWLEDPRMEKIMRISFIELYHNDQIKNFMLAFFGDGPRFFESSFAIMMKHKLIKPADPKVLTDEYMSFYMMALVDHFLLRYGSTRNSFIEDYGSRIEEHNEYFKNTVRP
ncbi:MAG TPA: TetR/AcrR family transcriptional regulator [Methanocella sp.]|uniref:TetR/AcrR family transcriptional regulator n=1 Tax=Methanocella sp. TaxID=2052833 RepID=UPI002D098600|nr:TetR/AcrR family transcriptional regulator [Methanocella sp.]HTY90258.1 TetR/AcrR family transcriptional regulator [Methanocella sp.]